MTNKEHKKLVLETVAFLRNVFMGAAAQDDSEKEGYILAANLLAQACTPDSTRADTKRGYMDGTTADTRRDAAAVIAMLVQLLPEFSQALAEASDDAGDDFVQKNCVCGKCHGPNVTYVDHPALNEMPPEVAEALRDLIKNDGLAIESVTSEGNSGFIAMSGEEEAVRKAHKIMESFAAQGVSALVAPAHLDIPPSILHAIHESKMGARDEPADEHTREISRALDKLGKRRPRTKGSDDFPKPH